MNEISSTDFLADVLCDAAVFAFSIFDNCSSECLVMSVGKIQKDGGVVHRLQSFIDTVVCEKQF